MVLGCNWPTLAEQVGIHDTFVNEIPTVVGSQSKDGVIEFLFYHVNVPFEAMRNFFL